MLNCICQLLIFRNNCSHKQLSLLLTFQSKKLSSPYGQIKTEVIQWSQTIIVQNYLGRRILISLVCQNIANIIDVHMHVIQYTVFSLSGGNQ